MSGKRIIVVHPHGFCSGVARAVATAEAALEAFGQPIYCLHEIVHNTQVVSDLAARGVRFVNRLADVPDGETVLFSAHGVAPAVRAEASARALRVIDATCPFVAKVHIEVKRFVAEGCMVVCIGHRRHEEVIGVAGEAPGAVLVVETPEEAGRVQLEAGKRVAVVSQTTLDPETVTAIRAVLRQRFPDLQQPERDDVCYATHNRQQAVRHLAGSCNLVLVLGSTASSNSRRLVETAVHAGGHARLISDVDELNGMTFDGVSTLGLASGASTPEMFLMQVLGVLRTRGFESVAELHAVAEEARSFTLPPLLKNGSR